MSDDAELKRLVLDLAAKVEGMRLDLRNLQRSLEERGVVLQVLDEVREIDIPTDIEELLNGRRT